MGKDVEAVGVSGNDSSLWGNDCPLQILHRFVAVRYVEQKRGARQVLFHSFSRHSRRVRKLLRVVGVFGEKEL